MTDIELLRQVLLQFQLPLRCQLPMPWPEFNRAARRYAEQKRARQLNRLWRESGKDFQRFARNVKPVTQKPLDVITNRV